MQRAKSGSRPIRCARPGRDGEHREVGALARLERTDVAGAEPDDTVGPASDDAIAH